MRKSNLLARSRTPKLLLCKNNKYIQLLARLEATQLPQLTSTLFRQCALAWTRAQMEWRQVTCLRSHSLTRRKTMRGFCRRLRGLRWTSTTSQNVLRTILQRPRLHPVSQLGSMALAVSLLRTCPRSWSHGSTLKLEISSRLRFWCINTWWSSAMSMIGVAMVEPRPMSPIQKANQLQLRRVQTKNKWLSTTKYWKRESECCPRICRKLTSKIESRTSKLRSWETS